MRTPFDRTDWRTRCLLAALLAAVAALPFSGCADDADDEDDLGYVTDGKGDFPAIQDRPYTLRARYFSGPSVKKLTARSDVDFRVDLRYQGTTQTRIVVIDTDTGARSESAKTTRPSLLVRATPGEEHKYRVRLENYASSELPVLLSILPDGPTVDLELLSVSDFHAQLDPVSVPMVGNVGGAAALATFFKHERAANPNTLVLTAGDAFGASPPLASFFEERPAVEAMSLMGFDADGLGNHNFDRGVAHLARMADLARYPFLSANLGKVDENMTCPSKPESRCVEPFRIFTVGGVKVAVVGVTNPDAMSLVKPGSLGTITVENPAVAALAARADAAAQGAQVFVLIAHMGATAIDGGTGLPTGPLVDLANQVSGFDVILGDHTNAQVNMTVNGALVVENKSQGLTWARVRLKVNKATGFVLDKSAEILTPMSDQVVADPAVVDLLAPYRTELAAQFDAPIGTATDTFVRGSNVERLREVPIGDLVADSLRLRYGTQLGFTNGGGIRAPLPSSYLPMDHALRRPAMGYAAGPPWDLVIGDVYTVLPFGNAAVTRTVTGDELWRMMEHSVEALPAANGWFGQISGFRVTFDSSKPAGSRVVSITLDDGTAVARDQTRYTMATSDFIDSGGDGYTFLAGGDGVSRDKMAEILLDHIRTLGTLTPAPGDRLVDLAPPPPTP